MIDNKLWQWVDEHMESDVTKLRLANHGNKELTEAINQIECRQRTRHKLRKTLQCRRFFFPNVLSSEQCTSDILAEFHTRLIPDKAIVLDMTCGLGIDVFHMAEKADRITTCDITESLADAARYNARQLGLENVAVKCADSVDILNESAPDSYDCIFIDPARRGIAGKRLFAVSDCSPDVTSLMGTMLKVANTAIVKLSPMLDVTHTLNELKSVSDIYAIGTRSECKEIVAVCRRNHEAETTIHAVTVEPDNIQIFSYTKQEETEAEVEYGNPVEYDFLYIPFPATMKAAPLRTLCSRFNMKKTGVNSHIYLSNTHIKEFPGKVYRIIKVCDFDKKGVREMSTSAMPGADITTRDFPIQAHELSKKLRLPGSNKQLILATKNKDGQRILILLREEPNRL